MASWLLTELVSAPAFFFFCNLLSVLGLATIILLTPRDTTHHGRPRA